jgi:hypothetical protein
MEAQIAALEAENERLKRCYASATGKPVCGEGSVIRAECKEMAALRALVRELLNEFIDPTTRSLIIANRPEFNKLMEAPE